MPRKPPHPVDAILGPYVAGESWPPEAEAEYERRQNRAFAEADDPSSVHNLRKLLELGKQRETADLQDALAVAKAKIAHDADRRERFWDAITTGIIVTVCATALLAFAALVYELSKLLPAHH